MNRLEQSRLSPLGFPDSLPSATLCGRTSIELTLKSKYYEKHTIDIGGIRPHGLLSFVGIAAYSFPSAISSPAFSRLFSDTDTKFTR